MEEARFRDWDEGTLRRPDGDSRIELMHTEQRFPKRLRLPIDDDWVEEFDLLEWEDDRPVYHFRGYTPRV
ncbi:hypothetical protein ABIA36_001078 [Leifsonia sp. EB34]